MERVGEETGAELLNSFHLISKINSIFVTLPYFVSGQNSLCAIHGKMLVHHEHTRNVHTGARSPRVSMTFRSVSCTPSLPVQHRPTHVLGSPEEFKSEESDKSGTEKDTNRANTIIKNPRT